MHNPPSPPLSSLHHGIPQMDPTPHHPLPINDDPSTSLWDWSDFLDFNLDDQFSIPLESYEIPPVTDLQPPPPIPASWSDNSDRVRKRDPRLVCSNFLAGRIPCACPELDALLEEAESKPGKRRARTVRAAGGTARCQVPGCEADISELKGYHRRHRVCLHCANASAVVLEGQNKRYCQQCGKFHILSDFDEGKRSCRRKLERHNNRRRRKPADCKENVEKEEAQQASLFDDGGCDNDTRKENMCFNSQSAEGGPPTESDGHVSVPCSADGSQNIHSDSIVSITASGETLIDEEKDKFTNSPPYLDDKSAFSSMCPTGRISFKLYDWNPAEFPRRLRHQIFQWLASMPVELEGYIRPGCTILTVFIPMPTFMWVKLFEDPVVYIQNLVASGNMLSGRGNFLLYLNNMIFHVTKGGTSVVKVKVEGRAPKLHSVHPTCFEAGKPMEFVACGSNLLQPKFRFLLSFGGKYLKYDVCVQPTFTKTNAATNLDHQLLKIYVPRTDRNHFGPAFIEVENESGLSNFIPIFIGDKEMCSEMKTIQQKLYTSPHSRESNFAASSSSCEASTFRQKENSEFILHVAWLLKEPSLGNVEHVLNSSQFQRFNFILDFLIQNESTAILDRVLYYMKTVINNIPATDIVETDMRLCQRKITRAQGILCQNLQKKVSSVVLFRDLATKEEDFDRSPENNVLSVVPVTNQDREVTERRKLDSMADLESASVPLLNRDVITRVNLNKERVWPGKSCGILSTSTASTSRPLIFVIAAAAVCFGICAVFLHPQKVGRLAMSVHRCLFYNP